MTTRSGPVFAVKVHSEPSQTVANCAVTKFCVVLILYDWGKMEGAESLNGGFPPYVVNTRLLAYHLLLCQQLPDRALLPAPSAGERRHPLGVHLVSDRLQRVPLGLQGA
jgi:hypothetical protein